MDVLKVLFKTGQAGFARHPGQSARCIALFRSSNVAFDRASYDLSWVDNDEITSVIRVSTHKLLRRSD